MEGDPKDPNAWWAIRFPSPLLMMFPRNWSKNQKKRLYWLVPLMVLIVSIEFFFVFRIMR